MRPHHSFTYRLAGLATLAVLISCSLGCQKVAKEAIKVVSRNANKTDDVASAFSKSGGAKNISHALPKHSSVKSLLSGTAPASGTSARMAWDSIGSCRASSSRALYAIGLLDANTANQLIRSGLNLQLRYSQNRQRQSQLEQKSQWSSYTNSDYVSFANEAQLIDAEFRDIAQLALQYG